MRFADTDAMGVVHHANYLAYFEMGRVDAMRQIGVEYALIHNQDVLASSPRSPASPSLPTGTS